MCDEKKLNSSHISLNRLYRFSCKKTVPINGKGVSFCRPIFSSGNFDRLRQKVLQVEKKSSVFSHPNKIAEKFQIHLTSADEEVADENNARKVIATAVSQIRNVLRGNTMLLQHNIEYGFWRNLIGGCLIAVMFSILIFVHGSYHNLKYQKIIAVICFIIYLLPIIFSKGIIRYYGKYYAKILYEQFLSI